MSGGDKINHRRTSRKLLKEVQTDPLPMLLGSPK